MSKRLGTLSIASMRDDMMIEPMAINALLAKLGTSDLIAALALEELVNTDLEKSRTRRPNLDLMI